MKRMFLMACVMCLMTGATLWAQSAEPLTLSYGNGVSRIEIYPDGYKLGSDAPLVPYTGAYVISGSSGGDALIINNESDVKQTFDITFRDLTIESGQWEGAVAISSQTSADTIVLNLYSSGTCLVRSGNHTALASRGNTEAPRIINLSVLDGTLTLETQHEAGGGFAWSSDYNTTFNLVNTLTIDGASSFTNSEQGSVTLKSNFLYTSNNDGTHQKTLAGNSVTEDCSYRYEPVEGAEQHKGICIHCGYQIEPEPCTPSDEWVVKDDQYHGKTCSICGQIVSPELHADLDNDHKCDYCGMVILAEPDRTAEGVYQISNMAELYWFAALVNGTLDTVPQETEADAVLTADIVINENVLTAEGELVEETDGLMAWTPMGSESAPFNGTFDGQGHTISGLYINQPSADVQGLFGYTGYDSNVSRIEVTGSYIHGQDGVGGITGYNFGTLTFCSYSGTVIGYYNYLGGVAGGNYGTVSCCYATGKVHATSSYPHVGGVVGNNYGTISSCYSTASFSADQSGSIGGVASYNAGGRHITDSYYLQGSADKGVDGNGGTVKNVESRTAEQFAGGEVTWLLNGQSDENPLWFQTLGTDTLPVWDNTHGTVYATGNCPGSITYNNQGPSQVGEHTDTDGDLKCDYCGMVILAEPDRTAEGVYQISNMAELYWFAALVNGTLDTVPQETEADAVLTADIVINENVLTAEGELVEETDGLMAWTPMGSESAPFNGTFDGQGHTISGLYINQPSADVQGLFGYTGYDSNVSRIEVTGSYIHGQDGVGGITGYNYGILTACSYSGTVIGNDYPLGGVVGENDGTVSCCYATGKVHATGSDPYVGGVVGDNYGTISSCYSTALLSADNSGPIGGVASYNDDGHITDSYYLQGSADKGVDKNWGTVENVESRTAEQFAGGEVTWLLNGQSDENPLWFQTLGTDTLPVWDNTHGTVYATGNCPGSITYNNQGPSQVGEHTDTDGDLKCDYCGMVILAEPDRTAEGVYQISNMAELYWFAALVNGTLDTVPQETEADAVLTADIVINENVLTAEGELVEETDGLMAWTSMGSESAPFNGTFDGQGHTISGLYINQPKADEQGLFGYVGSSGNVSWIEVTGSYIHGQDGVGGITGINNGLLTACSYSGTVIGYDYPIGGVAGENNGTVSCCYATGKVHATGSDPYVGGVVGDNYGTISSCYSTALLSTDNSGSIGGVASYNDGGPITDSYYLQGSADKGVDENGGTVENVESRTAEQFASGEVTWLLQHAITDDTQIWGQSLPADTLPMLLSEHKVYAALFIHETTSLQMMAKYGNLNAQIPLSTAEELGANGEVSFTDTLGNPLTETITLLSDTVILVNCRLYSITVSNNILNGDISVPYDSYNVGAEVTVEAIPYSGYEPLCLYVQTYDGQEYEYEDFSFTMPAADVVLSADFIPYLYGATYTISEDDNAYNVMLTWDYDASDCHTLIYRDGNLLHTTEVNETSWQEQISEDGVYNYTLYVENAQGVRSRGTLLTVYAYPSTPMGTSGTQSIDLGDVPELFTDDGGRNGNYSNDVDVTTEITAQEDCRIYLTGNYVLEQGYDYLQIYDSDNSRLRECNGMGTIEPALFSSGNTLSVRFTSDGSETYEGFELYVETVYPITIAEVENGTVESDTAWARAGGIVTLTPLPNEQYTYVEGSLKVLKADDPTVEVPVNADGSFTMPAFKITVTATFESSTALSVAETASWNVFGTDGMLHITGTEAEAEVYDVRGVLLYRGMDRNLYMPTGVYIVRAEGQVQKAIVK